MTQRATRDRQWRALGRALRLALLRRGRRIEPPLSPVAESQPADESLHRR